MPTEPSKYAENQFDSATDDNASLMSEVLADTMPRIVHYSIAHVELIPARDLLITAQADWDEVEILLTNFEAGQMGATLAFEQKLESLTRKPNIDKNSPLVSWDIIIGGETAFGSALYKKLLPRGRETVTAGTYHQRLEAIRNFSVRLTEQTAMPALVALGATVLEFYTEAIALRTAQVTLKTSVDNTRVMQENVRKLCAEALYGMIGLGQWVFRKTPLMIDSLFDVNILRQPVQAVPGPPIDTLWMPELRTLSSTAFPNGGTRFEAWRQGPGGAPERLATGKMGELSVVIPDTITFAPETTYRLWMQTRNAKGSSVPGPKTIWDAE